MALKLEHRANIKLFNKLGKSVTELFQKSREAVSNHFPMMVPHSDHPDAQGCVIF